MTVAAGVPPEAVERMRVTYNKDVAILSTEEVESIIGSGGFEGVVNFFSPTSFTRGLLDVCKAAPPNKPFQPTVIPLRGPPATGSRHRATSAKLNAG